MYMFCIKIPCGACTSDPVKCKKDEGYTKHSAFSPHGKLHRYEVKMQ